MASAGDDANAEADALLIMAMLFDDAAVDNLEDIAIIKIPPPAWGVNLTSHRGVGR
jgi:hypothetical protein